MHLYRWYAVYTHINEEQQMLDYLQKRGLKVYMPLRRHTAMVGKRKRTSYEPLFQSHLFVRTTVEGLKLVKQASSYSHMVRHGKYLAAISEFDIVKIKTILQHYEDVTSVPNNRVSGVPVAVVAGPLQGMVGMLDSGDGQRPIAMEIAQLGHSILVNVPMATVVRTVLATSA